MNERSPVINADPAARPPLSFSVPELATLLGISEHAVIAKIDRGELLGILEAGTWRVYMDLPEADGLRSNGSCDAESPHDEVLTVRHAATPRPNGTGNHGASPAVTAPVPVAVPISPVDLTLLINLVSDLTRRNAELLDTTATWRARVQHLESELQEVAMRDHHLVVDTAPAAEPDDPSPIVAELAHERERRTTAEADSARLREELRELRQLQLVMQSTFGDPNARAAAGWSVADSRLPAPDSWWRRLFR
jgi:hypothetical protein